MPSLALLVLLILCTPGPAPADIREEVLEVPIRIRTIYGQEVEQDIKVTIFRDEQRPKAPYLVLNHGRPLNDAGIRAMKRLLRNLSPTGRGSGGFRIPATGGREGTMELKGKHVAVLAEDLYEDLELWYPVHRFREAGAKVTVVGGGASGYTSKHGYPVTPDATAEKVSAADFDAVIIPGGYAPDRMRRHKAMVDLVRDMFAKGKVVAAICHGGWMLVSADVLRGRKATCFVAIKDDLVNAGARYEDREVVRDGNLVTSRKPDDLPAFCRTILQALSGAKA